MARSETTFDVRFGYARWLRHLAVGEAPGWAEIGRAVGLSGQAVSGWASRLEPPVNYEHHRPLAAFLRVNKDWLIEGQGSAPDDALWQRWVEAREAGDPFADGAEFPPQRSEPFDEDEPSTRATGTSGRRGAKRGRQS